jgi:GTPase
MGRELISTEKKPDQAILIGLLTPEISYDTFQEYMDELRFLLDTAGGEVQKIFIQKMERPDSRYFVGSGKIKDIAAWVEEHQPEMAIFDDELSPSQIRNIEKILNCRVMDRTNLILDIFAKRARTAHAKTQVELAQYQYMLPRLTRMWTHLEKQRGGIGLRGPGEKEIETDRRIIRDRIALLKEKLKEIDKQKVTQRKSRESLVRVSLVGYTNVGKSTIMNLLAKSEVFAEDKLFATLDTTVRKVVIGNLPFLLTDTVGFIRKLPHGLIESFKSTLDEVRESDIIVHVVDIAHPAYQKHMDTVEQTLKEIEAGNKKTIMIFNKMDAYKDNFDPDDLAEDRKPALADLKNHWLNNDKQPCLFISAKEKTNIEEFRKLLYREVVKIHTTRYPFDDFLY